MTEFDDLLAGIRANPTDEMRRLVFADWLEEHADDDPLYAPWASYIRWAIAAARTARTDPDYWKYRRYPEQPPYGAARRLGIEGLPGRFEWNAGFPDSLELAVDTLKAHDRRFASILGPLRRLQVNLLPSSAPNALSTRWVAGPTVARAGTLEIVLGHDDPPAFLAALAERASQLPPLSLNLLANPATVSSLVENRYPSLVGLTLHHFEELDRLTASPNLGGITALTLHSSARLPPGSVRPVVMKMPRLERLNLTGAIAESALADLASDCCQNLRSLDLDSSAVRSPAWAAFLRSETFLQLDRLSFNRRRLESGAEVWPPDVEEPQAGPLVLKITGFASSCLNALLVSPLLHRCCCLFVENADLTRASYVALAANRSARNLKVLSVQRSFQSKPVASGTPFAELCRSPHLANLTELSLTFHYFTDDDFEQLLNATFADKLRYLNLAGSYFSEEALAKLLDPDVLPELTWLDLHGPKGEAHPLISGFRQRFGPNFAF